MLHGVNYGYDTMDQRFLNESHDIKFIHTADKKFKKIKKLEKKKHKDNIVYIDFSKEGIKDDA